MLITFTGPDNILIDAGFFGNDGLNVENISDSDTYEFVMRQPDTGVVTTITGTGLMLDDESNPVAGRISGFSFS
ncbi:MAG: hypothetical protein R3D81_04730 [Thalassovita sp.]